MKVSVILPTHNRASFIGKAIQSVRSQTLHDLELIIVDDISNDQTQEIVQSFMQKDPRIVYTRQREKTNLQACLNKGLTLAHSTYIARIDDDDEWIDRRKIERQVYFLDQHPDYHLIGSAAIIEQVLPNSTLYSFSPPKTDSHIRRWLLARNWFASSTVLFRKHIAIQLGGYDETSGLSGDYDLWLKLGTKGKFANFSAATTKLRKAPEHLNERRLVRIRDSIRIIKRHRTAYPHYQIALLGWYAKLLYLRLPFINSLDALLYQKRMSANWKI